MSLFPLLLNSQDFVSLITSIIDILAVSVVAISIIQAIIPTMKVMIRTLAFIINSSYHERRFQEQNYTFKYKERVAKKNLVRGLLFALELESANAVLKMGVFTSLFIGDSSLAETSSTGLINNFLIFIAILSVRIGINQGLRRFDKGV